MAMAMTGEPSDGPEASRAEGEERSAGLMLGNSYSLLTPADEHGRRCPRSGVLVGTLALVAIGLALLTVPRAAIYGPSAGRIGGGDRSAAVLVQPEAKAEVSAHLREEADKADKGDKADKVGKADRVEKADKADKADTADKAEKADKADKAEGRGEARHADGSDDDDGGDKARKPDAGSKAFLPAAPHDLTEREAGEERGKPVATSQEPSNPWGWWSAFTGSVVGAVDDAAMALHLMTSTSTSTHTTTTTTETHTTTSTTHTKSTTTTTSLTTTTTTVTTTTRTTTSTRLATLFCFSVIRTVGYEPPLMEQLYKNKASIFSCEDVALYSTGQTILIGPIATVHIVAPQINMGNLSQSGTTTSSWLNTKIFMMAWELVLKDGRWWNHEWTVKADPDAVFFPHRLKVRLYPYYTAGVMDGPALYMADCDRTWNGDPPSLKIYGSLEVYSRNALGMYNHDHQRCEKELAWKNWGEDFYMQMCLDKLGVSVVNGVSWVSDVNCYQVPCTDISKVAYHAYKDAAQYMDCWTQSSNAENGDELAKAGIVNH